MEAGGELCLCRLLAGRNGRSQLHGDGSRLSPPEPTGQAPMAVRGTTRLLAVEGPFRSAALVTEERRARDQIHRGEAIGPIHHRGPCVCDRSEVEGMF